MRKSTLLVAAIAATLSTSALAQSPVGSNRATVGEIYGNIYGGATFYDSDALLGLGSKNNAGTGGVRLGTRMAPHFGAELDFDYSHTPFKTLTNDRFRGQFTGALVGVLYAFDRDSTPFMTLGVGASSNRFPQSTERTEHLMTVWGLGYKHRVGRSLDLRVDAQDQMLWNTPADRGGVLNNLKLTAGVGFAWGGRKPMPQPVAAPAPTPAPAPALPPAVPPAQLEPMPAPAPVTEVERTLLEHRPVVIEAANFDFDSAKIKPSARQQLDEIAQFAQKYPDANFTVDGHTDSIGTIEYNRKLSLRRAQAVKNELAKQGVAEDRMQVRGLGESRPIASNKTAAGRAKNRRVEVRTTVTVERTTREVRPGGMQQPGGMQMQPGGMQPGGMQ